jgi:hypothetical protein
MDSWTGQRKVGREGGLIRLICASLFFALLLLASLGAHRLSRPWEPRWLCLSAAAYRFGASEAFGSAGPLALNNPVRCPRMRGWFLRTLVTQILLIDMVTVGFVEISPVSSYRSHGSLVCVAAPFGPRADSCHAWSSWQKPAARGLAPDGPDGPSGFSYI